MNGGNGASCWSWQFNYAGRLTYYQLQIILYDFVVRIIVAQFIIQDMCIIFFFFFYLFLILKKIKLGAKWMLFGEFWAVNYYSIKISCIVCQEAMLPYNILFDTTSLYKHHYYGPCLHLSIYLTFSKLVSKYQYLNIMGSAIETIPPPPPHVTDV